MDTVCQFCGRLIHTHDLYGCPRLAFVRSTTGSLPESLASYMRLVHPDELDALPPQSTVLFGDRIYIRKEFLLAHKLS